MGRYDSRAEEIDRMLRAGRFVDLYQIVKQAMRAGVEVYSLKELEVFFGFERDTQLADARKCIRHLEFELEMCRTDQLPDVIVKTVESYNRDDCLSTLYLRELA